MDHEFVYIEEEWMINKEDHQQASIVEEENYRYGLKEFSFERLEVWSKSLDLVEHVYELTREFPSEEKFSLTSQIRRSAISAPSNIAEGTSRRTSKDKIHFLNIAYSSLIELVNHLVIALRLGYIAKEDYVNARLQIQSITAMINALVRAFERSQPSGR